ncbi:MAG: nucleotidyltransferase family protein [Flavitalea sp.]
MITQAIILAGGLGTRLRSAVPDLPKCMAPVAGKPFIDHVINYFFDQGISSFVFALGYMNEVIIDHIKNQYPDLDARYSIETELLGTGGAIRLACGHTSEENVLVLNGDSILKIDLEALSTLHSKVNAECTLALKPMTDFERYGVVETDQQNRITSFKEKQFYSEGLINGGIYAVHVPSFIDMPLTGKFSFEKDYLEAYYPSGKIYGQIQDEYFIDIGIPEDFARAQEDFK